MSLTKIRTSTESLAGVSSIWPPSVIHPAHGQVDGSSRYPARPVGRHERRNVRHLLERHEPFPVSPAREHLLPLFPSHAARLGARLVGVLDRTSLWHCVRSQTDH